MLFTCREVRIRKNCDRGLECVLKNTGTVSPYTDRPRKVNNIFIFFQHLPVCRSILKGCQNARKFNRNYPINTEKVVFQEQTRTWKIVAGIMTNDPIKNL